MPQENQQTDTKTKTRKMLLVYALVFIGVVLLLVLISLFAQMRENSALEEELQGQKTEFHGVAEKYKAIQEEHDTLIAEKDALAEENSELRAALSALDEWTEGETDPAKAAEILRHACLRAEALARLSELQRTWRSGTRAECRALIDGMEAAGDPTRLTAEELNEYQYIQKKSGYAD